MIRPFKKNSLPSYPYLAFDWSLTKGRPVALEIGCGTGLHALKYANHNPDSYMIALERTSTKFKALRALLTDSPPSYDNLYTQQADALFWAAQNLTEGVSLDEIFILYPNPYPKEKQSNLRFQNMPFTGFLLQFLKPQGRLTLATNIAKYHTEAVEKFVEVWGLEIQSNSKLPQTSEPRTQFEKKYLERGETCYNLVLTKPN